jgi:hypothetical protein
MPPPPEPVTNEPVTNEPPSAPDDADGRRSVIALVGVYDADGTPLGELSYFVGARLGRAHCSLCEITHGLVRAKAAWGDCRAALPIPFDTFHRNDAPASVRAAADGAWPTVVAELDDGSQLVLLGPDDLEACDGSLDAMVGRLADAASLRDLALDLGGAAPA